MNFELMTLNELVQFLAKCHNTGHFSQAYQHAFAELLARTRESIERVFYNKYSVHNEHQIADLTQNVYLKLLKDNGRILTAFRAQYENSFYSYLFLICRTVFNEDRAGKVEFPEIDLLLQRIHSQKSSEQLDYELRQASEALQHCMDAFIRACVRPEEYGPICRLYFLDGLKPQEIVAHPGISLSQAGVYRVIDTARKHIEACYYKH